MGILDRKFKYVPASRTDIRKTFRRERRRLAEEAQRTAANDAEAARKVAAIARGKGPC